MATYKAIDPRVRSSFLIRIELKNEAFSGPFYFFQERTNLLAFPGSAAGGNRGFFLLIEPDGFYRTSFGVQLPSHWDVYGG